MFVEAEELASLEGWEAVPSQRGIYADVPSGMRALRAAGRGPSEAAHTVVVPAAGTYRLWLRYVRWPDEAHASGSAIHARVEQGGRTVLERDFEARFDPGQRPSPHETRRGRFDWEAGTVTLAAGEARITLGRSGSGPGRREVDCLLLTTDTQYQPDYRDFAPQTYLRIRLRSADVPEPTFTRSSIT